MAGWGDEAVTKGMCYKQKMAVRKGKSPWRRGKSRSGGKDSRLEERYDCRKKRRSIDEDNEVKTERPSRKPGGEEERKDLLKKKRWQIIIIINRNSNE